MGILIAQIVVGVLTTLATIVAAWLLLKGKREDAGHVRLAQIEALESKCRHDLFEMRQEMQSLYFIIDILTRACPEAEQEVKEVTARVKARRRKNIDGGLG